MALCLSAAMCISVLGGCGSRNADTQSVGTERVADAQDDTESRWIMDPADVFVQPVEGISDDFIRGMDASAVLSIEKSGAKYYGLISIIRISGQIPRSSMHRNRGRA